MGPKYFFDKVGFCFWIDKVYSFLIKKINSYPRKISNTTNVIGDVGAYNGLGTDVLCSPCTPGIVVALHPI